MFNEKEAVQSVSLAMLNLAIDDLKLEELYNDLCNLKDFDKKDYALKNFLKNPWISKNYKIESILKLNKCFNYDKTSNLIALLVQRNSTYLLDKIILETIKLLKEKLGFVTLKIYAAFELNKEQISQIENSVLNSPNLLPSNFKKIDTNFIVDKLLIGGIKIQINSKVIDNSFLEKIRKTKYSNSKINLNHINLNVIKGEK